MRVALATAAGGRDHPNEDFAACTPNSLVLLDGAGTPAGSQSGCSHGVSWFTHQLGTTLLAELDTRSLGDLRDRLATAINLVRDRHQGQCDLDHPGSPSATVLIARRTGPRLDYLILADSVLVLRTAAGTRAFTDDREARIGSRYRAAMDAAPSGTVEHIQEHRRYVESMRRHRNTEDGFWVASSNPRAAAQAITGSIAVNKLHDFALLSDGASRLADRFALRTWPEVMNLLSTDGPTSVIDAVRSAEASDPAGKRWPRGKSHDDATVIYARVDRSRPADSLTQGMVSSSSD